MPDASPLVISVVEDLHARIRSGALPAGKGLPSERRLVEELQVSRGVVRAAIRKLEELGVLSCQPNCRPVVRAFDIAASHQTASSLKHLAIWIWPNPGDYSASSILKGIQSTEIPSDVRLVVASVPYAYNWEACLEAERAFLKSVAQDSHTCGLILYYLGGQRNRAALEEIRLKGIPMVFVDRLPPAPFDADHVGSDSEEAARTGVQHLINLGHERIALISNQDEVSTVFGREAGYRRALRDSRIPLRSELVLRDTIGEPDGVDMAVEELLALDSPPTAIVGINDHIALQVYESLQSRGVSVPRDMSVLGFDGLLRWVPGGGYLTTSCQDFERIGQMATEIILERSKETSPFAFRHIFLHAPLKICGSTDAPQSPMSVQCNCSAD